MATPIDEGPSFDFVKGQVQILMAFAQAVAALHPDQSRLAFFFEGGAEKVLAQAENRLIDDEQIEGIQDAHARIRSSLGRKDN